VNRKLKLAIAPKVAKENKREEREGILVQMKTKGKKGRVCCTGLYK